MRLLSLVVMAAIGCGGGGGAGAPDAGSPAPDANPEDALLEEMFRADRLLEVRIELADEDWDLIRYQHADLQALLVDDCPGMHPPRPYDYVSGTVTIDGEVIEDVGIRKKGFLGSASAQRPSIKLSFNEYVPGRIYHGLRRMTLNNNLQDDASMSTCLSLQVFRAAGVPAPRCNHARVWVNDTYLGVYSHVESIRPPFLARQFAGDNDGNLYEGTLADLRPVWVDMYQDKPNNDGDRGDLAGFVTALEASDADLLDELAPILDLDEYMTFWAAEVLVGHWDGQAGNRNNHYLYRDSGGKFHFMPWSPDDGFGPANPFLDYVPPASVFANSQLPRRLYLHPGARAMYQAALQRLLDEVWDETELLAEIERMSAMIRPHLLAPELHDARKQQIIEYVEDARGRIEASLADNPGWEHELPDTICIAPRGQIEGTFTAIYRDQFPPANPLVTGNGTVTATLDGVPQTIVTVGAATGPEGNPNDPRTGVMIFAMRDDNTAIIPWLLVDPELYAAGGAISVDMYDVFGLLLVSPSPGQIQFLGFVSGTLQLDEVASADGEMTSGSFTLEWLRGEAL